MTKKCHSEGQTPSSSSCAFTLTLRPEAGWNSPPIARLKRALKMLLRGFGLRCVSITESTSENTSETPSNE